MYNEEGIMNNREGIMGNEEEESSLLLFQAIVVE